MTAIIYIILFIVGLIAVVITLSVLNGQMGSKKVKTWNCETCKITLQRHQIKFGLCPKCGQKVPNFRGLTHFSSP